MPRPPPTRNGRGTASRLEGRFEERTREAFDDGWDIEEDAPERIDTQVRAETVRSIIATNRSPDIPFEQSINPYRGCEHGCIYCYARASHAWLNLSPGIDFETRLFYKVNAARLLEQALRRPGYRVTPISLGANTDPYQPIERELRVTRSIIEVLQRFRHPLTIVTKGAALIRRDLDILAEMAAANLASVAVSITTLDDDLKRRLEPRAASPSARLRLIEQLASAGVPVSVMVAPVIPVLTDTELEALLKAGRDAGATRAGYILLRLPHEVSPLFRDWLQLHVPLKARHVMNVLQDMRGGRDNDAQFGRRQRGSGIYADLLAQRFRVACRRLGLATRRDEGLDCSAFRIPPRSGDQLDLFT